MMTDWRPSISEVSVSKLWVTTPSPLSLLIKSSSMTLNVNTFLITPTLEESTSKLKLEEVKMFEANALITYEIFKSSGI